MKNTAGGKTYADLGVPQAQLRAQVAEAAKNNDPNLAALRQQLADVTAQRETVFKGETLRGLLLTTYGFSEFGVKAGQAALVAYLAALVLALLSIAGFIHAYTPPARWPSLRSTPPRAASGSTPDSPPCGAARRKPGRPTRLRGAGPDR